MCENSTFRNSSSTKLCEGLFWMLLFEGISWAFGASQWDDGILSRINFSVSRASAVLFQKGETNLLPNVDVDPNLHVAWLNIRSWLTPRTNKYRAVFSPQWMFEHAELVQPVTLTTNLQASQGNIRNLVDTVEAKKLRASSFPTNTRISQYCCIHRCRWRTRFAWRESLHLNFWIQNVLIAAASTFPEQWVMTDLNGNIQRKALQVDFIPPKYAHSSFTYCVDPATHCWVRETTPP